MANSEMHVPITAVSIVTHIKGTAFSVINPSKVRGTGMFHLNTKINMAQQGNQMADYIQYTVW